MNIPEWAKRYGITAPALSELLAILAPPPVTAVASPYPSESEVQKKIRLATNFTGGLLLRNNSGAAREVRTDGRTAFIRYGLGNDSKKINAVLKSSDLIGVTPMTIRPEDVGRVWGIFTAIETKRPGWKYAGTEREVAQLNFINVIKARGGAGGFAVDPADYFNALGELRK